MGNDARDLREQVGPQCLSIHDAFSGSLEGSPPFRADSNSVVQPIADKLLTGLAIASMGLQGVGESLLAATGKSDGFLQRGDVGRVGLFSERGVVHDRRDYTSMFVRVNKPDCFPNKPDCVTPNKSVCNIVNLQVIRESRMPARARKLEVVAPKVAKKKRRARPGADGKTLGQRILEAMAYRAGKLDQPYKIVHLGQDVNELLGCPPDQPELSQQNLSAIIRTSSDSYYTPFIARVCGVDPVWLAAGIGQMVTRRRPIADQED